jgi:Zn-dependent protease/predicted transcriptional regulator
MFGESYNLFRILGFEVRANVSWLFLALLITWSLAERLFPFVFPDLAVTTYWLMALAGMLGLFASLLFHELSHSLVARAHGLPVGGITLFLFGGMAELTAEPKTPKIEFQIAIAGPIASVVLGGAFWLLAVLMQAAGVPAHLVGIASYLGFINFLLAVFNMVPGYPLDGGRVLRAALWHWKKDIRWATLWASRGGQGFGLLLVGLGFASVLAGNIIGGMWWFLIGMFVFAAAKMGYQQLVTKQALEGREVRRFMTANPVTVPAQTTVRDFVEQYLYHYALDMFPVVRDGRLVGCASLRQARETPREAWDGLRVADICQDCAVDNTVEAHMDAGEALDRMRQANRGRLMVTENGRLVGVLVLKDLLRFLQVREQLREDRPVSR